MASLPRTALLLPLLSLGALCDPAVIVPPPDHSDPDTDDSRPLDAVVPLQDVQARLHETIESLVYLSWEQLEPATVWVEYGLDGETWHSSPALTLEPGPQQALLLGLPYGVEGGYRVLAQGDGYSWQGDPGLVTTGEQPHGVPSMEVLAVDPARLDPDTHFLLASIEEINTFGVATGSWSFIFDRMGRVVWALETPQGRATIHARVSYDGADLLIDHNSFYGIFDWGALSQVARVKIDGTQLALYDTPGLHHPFTELPDHSIVYAATADTYDSIVQLQPSGERETLWACQPFQEGLGVEQYCTSNTLVWNEPSASLLISFYSSETVVEIDRESRQATRWFGHLPGAWGFDPEDSAFWWQHGAHFTDDGTLLVSTKIADGGEETVVREYALDEDAQLLRQVWSFGEGQGIYGNVMGEAHRLGNGNTLHNYGSGTRVREITPSGELVWDVTFSSGTYLGRTTPLADLYALAP